MTLQPRHAAWRRRGAFLCASAALHLVAVVAWVPAKPTPARQTTTARGAPMRVMLLAAASREGRIATPPAPSKRLARAIPTSAARSIPLHATTVGSPPAATPQAPDHVAPPPPAAVQGIALGAMSFGGFGGFAVGGSRLWRTSSATAPGVQAAADPALRPQAPPQPDDQDRQVQLQQVWAAMQAQVDRWSLPPPDSAALTCVLPRDADSTPACDGIAESPGLAALLETAQAFYQLVPGRQNLVLAYADGGYRIELVR